MFHHSRRSPERPSLQRIMSAYGTSTLPFQAVNAAVQTLIRHSQPDAPARVRDAQRGDEARREAGGDDGRVERAPEEERGGLSFIPDGAVTTVGWGART